MALTVTVDGRPCDVSQVNGWTFRYGVQPVIRRFVMTEEDAAALSTKTAPVAVVLDDGEESLTVEGLYVVGQAPVAQIGLGSVLLADARYWLPRQHVLLRANIPTEDVDGDTPVMEDTGRALSESSLDPAGRPWTRDSFLRAVMRSLKLPDGSPLRWTIGELPGEGTYIYDVVTDLSGDSALAHALGHNPGVSVWVDQTGTFRIVDTTRAAVRQATRERGDVDLFDGMGPPVEGSERIIQQLHATTRPVRVACLISAKMELRFDAVYGGTSVERDDPLILDPVVRVPDLTLELTNGETVRQGAFVLRSDYIAAIAANPVPGQSDRLVLNDDLVKRTWFNNAFSVRMQGVPETPRAALFRRWDALRSTYRRLFRVRRATKEKILRITPRRLEVPVAAPPEVLQPAQFEGGPPVLRRHQTVWSPYSARYDRLGDTVSSSSIRYFDPFDSQISLQRDPDELEAAPATVRVIDQDSGIILIEYTPRSGLDGFSIEPGIAVGQDESSSVPAPDVRLAARGREGVLIEQAKLRTEHHLATIMTVELATPNNKDRLFRLFVDPSQITDLLPRGYSSLPRLGPEQEVRIPDDVVDARFSWQQANQGELKAVIRTGEGRLFDEASLVNGDEVRKVAEAYAAAVYMRHPNRKEGTHITRFNPELMPRGGRSVVSHDMGGDDGSGGGPFSITSVTTDPSILIRPDPITAVPEALYNLIARRHELRD